jgi:hypothetical protein
MEVMGRPVAPGRGLRFLGGMGKPALSHFLKPVTFSSAEELKFFCKVLEYVLIK